MGAGLLAAWLAAAAIQAPATAPAQPSTLASAAPAAATPPAQPAAPPQPPPDFGATVRGAFLSAEAARGPLDGSWRLAAADGRVLYVFQFADSGGAPDPSAAAPQAPSIEGAWRDPGRAGALDASGFLAACHRDGDELTILFYDAGARALTVRLQASGADWSGVLDDGAKRQAVVMRRD